GDDNEVLHPAQASPERRHWILRRLCNTAQCMKADLHAPAPSRPYFRSRKYNCVREMPSCRAALALFALTLCMARSIAWRSTTFSSVLSTMTETIGGGARDRSFARISPFSQAI